MSYNTIPCIHTPSVWHARDSREHLLFLISIVLFNGLIAHPCFLLHFAIWPKSAPPEEKMKSVWWCECVCSKLILGKHRVIPFIARMPLVRCKYIGLNVIDIYEIGITLPCNDEMEMPKIFQGQYWSIFPQSKTLETLDDFSFWTSDKTIPLSF